jgi:hypothetical protein
VQLLTPMHEIPRLLLSLGLRTRRMPVSLWSRPLLLIHALTIRIKGADSTSRPTFATLAWILLAYNPPVTLSPWLPRETKSKEDHVNFWRTLLSETYPKSCQAWSQFVLATGNTKGVRTSFLLTRGKFLLTIRAYANATITCEALEIYGSLASMP